MRSCSRSAAGVCATVRAGCFAGLSVGDGAEVWNRLISPQAAKARVRHSRVGAAQSPRLILFSRRPKNPATAATRVLPGELVPTEQLDLSHPEHFDSRPAPRLDPTADANPSIFERFKGHSGRLERRYRAP
jgi:hypothetical protein